MNQLDQLNEYEEYEDLTQEELEEHKRQTQALKSLHTLQDINIHKFIKRRFKSAVLIENIGSKMTYSISNSLGPNFERNFNNLEVNLTKLGIDSMSISGITLEEIFIRLTNEEVKSSNKALLDEDQMTEYSKYPKMRVDKKSDLVMLQFKGLILKRFHRTKRNLKGCFAEVIVPILFIIFALIVALIRKNMDTYSYKLELHPWYYTKPNVIFLSKSSDPTKTQSDMNDINRVVDTFWSWNSIGTRCLNGNKIPVTMQDSDEMTPFYECETYDSILSKNISNNLNEFDLDLIKRNYSLRITPECECTNDAPMCPVTAGGDISLREIVKLKTKDLLYNLTDRNVTDWLVKTEFKHEFFEKRYGGFEFLSPLSNVTTNSAVFNLNKLLNSLSKSFFNQTPSLNVSNSINLISNKNVKIWYNLKGFHSSPAYLNVLNNAFLRSKSSNSEGIRAFNHPFDSPNLFLNDKIVQGLYYDLFISVCVIFGLSLVPASFLVFLLEERQTNSKQLQFVSGVKPFIYWFSNLVWDLLTYSFTSLLAFIFFVIFGVESFTNPHNIGGLFVLILLYGWACIPLMYLFNFIFKDPSTGFVVSSTLNFFIGVFTTVCISLLINFIQTYPNLRSLKETLEIAFIILFPQFCLGQGFMNMSFLYTLNSFKDNFNLVSYYDVFSMDNLGRNLLAMFLQGCLFNLMSLVLEYDFFIQIKPRKSMEDLNLPEASHEDDDVSSERKRILNKKSSPNDYIRLVNLVKIYKKFKIKKCGYIRKVAVNQLNLGMLSSFEHKKYLF